jgi:hypothetical protein
VTARTRRGPALPTPALDKITPPPDEAIAHDGSGRVGRDVLTTALAAHDAGLCVVRAATDGSKRPAGKWKQYQTERPDRATVEEWFAGGHPGLGLICGQVSGGLEMFEFEGRATSGVVLGQFLAAADTAGLTPLVERITSGYAERTPSGGLHWVYRCATVGGNEKLASNADAEPLIETRGEGGFTVIAPSNGTTHPTGGAWEMISGGVDSIATITPEERAALFDLARSFDAMPTEAPGPKEAPRGHSDQSQVWDQLGEDDRPGDVFDREHTCHAVLLAAGFTEHHTDGDGTHYTRPGKERREGSSATVWKDNGTATLFSTSIDAPAEAIGKRNLRPWQLHVHLRHRGDFTAAAKEYAARLGRGRRADPTTGEVVDRDRPSGPPTLPDEFWSARPVLSKISEAARSRRAPRDAVLGHVLARVAACTPHTVKLPAIVGGHVGLSYFVAPIASSGGGKTAGAGVAAEIIPSTGATVEVPAGTGEGIVESLFDKDDDGNRVQTRHALIISVDEGTALMEVAARQGSTTMSMLRQGYTDGPIGNTNASPERRRIVPRGQYVFGLVVAFQPAKAAPLLDDADAGTPQRFLWVAADDPDVPDQKPAWPEGLTWAPPNLSGSDPVHVGGYRRHLIGVPDDIAGELDAARVRQLRREDTDADPLDAHAGLVRLKTAALLAILDGRLDVNAEDWHLAGIMYRTSAAVRSYVVAVLKAERAEQERSEHRRAAARDAHLEDAATSRALASGAASIGRRVHNLGRASRRDLHAAVKSTHRKLVPLDDMIDRAQADGLIARDGDQWVRGRRSA